MTTRRDLLKAAALAPLAFIPLSEADAMRAANHAENALEQAAAGTPYKPVWFTADEWRQLHIVVNLIIPKDSHSGSATDAGVPEYMDWTCKEYAPQYNWMRDALRYLDGVAYSTYHKNFVHISDAERKAIFDQIAWPAKAKPEMAEGVQHFNRLRDFTGAGFFSSKMGVADLKYLGNVARPSWDGCPKPALDHLGVSYS